jgi:hypothetical protein
MRGSHSPTRRRPLSRRAKVVAAAATATVVAGGALGYFLAFPQKAPAFVRSAMSTVGLPTGPVQEDHPTPPVPTCPLTGEDARGGVPDRPALAVKVENYPEARPQAGLQSADLVYEEPVEGGITRFIVLFQCRDVDRVGPVRSVRTTDPQVLSQVGVPILAYSGGAPNVVRVVEDANLVPVDETRGGSAFTRDESRAAPHNLYADTGALYRVARDGAQAPAPVFAYADEIQGRSRRVSSIHLPFSSTYADVFWAWSRRAGEWRRSHGGVPHVDESGEPISAVNVVVQLVPVVVGPHGGLTPHLELTGSGRAYVFRDGRMIVGRWERSSLHDVTTFVTKNGEEIALAPGRTWVELFPDDLAVETSR